MRGAGDRVREQRVRRRASPDEGSRAAVYRRRSLQLDRILCGRQHGRRLGKLELDGGPRHQRHHQSISNHRHVRRGRQLLRRRAGRLQLHAGEPCRARRRIRCDITGVADLAKRREPLRRLDRRQLQFHVAGARRGELRRDHAGVRHGARPHRLRTWQLAVLCNRRWRLGWAAGAGAEVPFAPHWTARFQYLFTDYGTQTTQFSAGAQPVSSDFMVHELSLGLNYQFNAPDAAARPIVVTKAPGGSSADELSLSGQNTFVWQGYPAIKSPFQGTNSLPSGGQGKETYDLTLFAGARLWRGAELWIDPEIDQGHGLAETHGVAGFPSGESYKLGADYPYARVQRYFIRQTIDLGGDKQKIDADVNQFAQSTTENRLVLWLGKFSIVDVFDTNKYANNPKTDFMNWALINAGTFDYAGDAWGYTYGGAAEWYQGRFTVRAGAFDLSASPAGGGNNAQAYGLDPTFQQFELVGEIEERHALWGQPGKLKVTGYLERGNMGTFSDAVALSQLPGPLFGDPTNALAAVRHYQSRPGVSLNLEQQVNETVGVFARAGWADGQQEPWDFTDIDRTVHAGVSINGKSWNRPDDTIGVAGIVNGIDPAHQAYFAAGGLGVLVGDGALPSYGLEQILEAYYSYAISPTMKVSFDYQFIANPGYNADRGPVNVFAGRFHSTF